jgi:hypothetical protein
LLALVISKSKCHGVIVIAIKEILQATFASRDFSQFFTGVEFNIPNSSGHSVLLGGELLNTQ